ncbi:TIGR03885 family FMN-dependent LLM class oxidoreductase [Streptomyces sp. NPDC006638]|uniref:TIGR03885 family FMN-dependent LLM class oxidoreductase n=1 Tax=Streptomyces sp. NPDC006638 TaxID=3157183 RepID=UPI0033AEFA53
MTVYGFHASHEQVPPGDLLNAVVHAEEAGFTAAMCSDHFSPWSARQGESGFAWSWLGAALQATGRVPFGVVNAPGQRYHPAVIAQAIGSLGAMFPGRFWAALGSGEASNEHITGDRWPRKDVRNARLRECVDIIRALLRGEEVSHDGLVTVDRAKLWTRPESVPPLFGAACSEATAAWCADWADGLITVNAPHEQLRRIADAYRSAGGTGPLYLQAHLSWAPSDDEARALAHDQWRTNVHGPPASWDLDTAELFDVVSEHVSDEQVADSVRISADLGQHAAWLQEYADLGFDAVMLHHVGQEQEAFIDAFGAKVLPRLDVTEPPPAVAETAPAAQAAPVARTAPEEVSR